MREILKHHAPLIVSIFGFGFCLRASEALSLSVRLYNATLNWVRQLDYAVLTAIECAHFAI